MAEVPAAKVARVRSMVFMSCKLLFLFFFGFLTLHFFHKRLSIEDPCGACYESEEYESHENEGLAWRRRLDGDCSGRHSGIHRSVFLHFRFRYLHLLCRLVVEVECEGGLVLQAFACGLGRMEDQAVVAVEIVGVFLLGLVVVVLSLLVEEFGIFEILTRLVGSVVCDVFLQTVYDGVGQCG